MPRVTRVGSLQEFDDIIKNAGDAYVAVDFFATWCGPCRTISPLFEKFSDTYTGIKFLSVDADECSDLAQREDASALPTFKFFHHGKEVHMFRGADPSALEDFLKKHNDPWAQSGRGHSLSGGPSASSHTTASSKQSNQAQADAAERRRLAAEAAMKRFQS